MTTKPATLSREEIALRIAQLPPEQQAEAAQLALQIYGPADVSGTQRTFSRFKKYQFDATSYIRDKLNWSPWSGADATGDDELPGQSEIIAAYELALQQQIERRSFENGEMSAAELKVWQPGQVIKNRLRVEAGHSVGKTKLSSGLVNHFFDCFPPAIIYTFAPTAEQIKRLLWKEIAADRKGANERGQNLPGKVLETCEIKYRADHFAIGRATDDSGGKGTERVQGQHGEYLMFVLDEAEGVADFVFDAVDSMASGGIVIVLMLANPRTRSSRFYKQKDLSSVKSFRISCLQHPNVVQGRELVPGAVKRQYVEDMVEKHCEVASSHSPDDHTFTLPFPIQTKNGILSPGTILRPNAEFLFRVLGIPPANLADNTFVPPGRYEAATKRTRDELSEAHRATNTIRMGVDVSRYGKDFGTLYVLHQGTAWREDQFWKEDTSEYAGSCKSAALRLWNAAPDDQDENGVYLHKPTSLHIRIDGTGGFGSGVVDALKNDPSLIEKFPDFRVLEVHFSSVASDEGAYANIVSQMYGEAGEALKGIRIENAPEFLEGDVCERTYDWINREGVSVKKITEKEKFKAKKKRSPDDGDGFVLCVSPDHIFKSGWVEDNELLDWLKNR